MTHLLNVMTTEVALGLPRFCGSRERGEPQNTAIAADDWEHAVALAMSMHGCSKAIGIAG